MDKNGLWGLVVVVFVCGFVIGFMVSTMAGRPAQAWHARVPPNALYSVTPFDKDKTVKGVCQINSNGIVADHITIFDSDGQILGESSGSSQQK